MADHVVPKKTYYQVGAALMVLLAVTVGIAYIHLGPLNIVAAMIVAVTKAALVVLFFMHVKYGSRLTWVFVAGGFIWLVIMFVLTLGDYIARWF